MAPPSITQMCQEIVTESEGQPQILNIGPDAPSKTRSSPKTKRLPPITSKAKMPTVVITPQALITQNNPSYPLAIMAALLHTAIS
ncbi:hypothetical protein PNOK_0738800 [Pyrrhoderma noxium]|uniref:Uncharacterized protein n=1 Tax=Pyrrhoderma noxium TaxID=2282107 RepID=A0A286UCS4_9AGAM|nr:hypothetical protein PNOK_0819800 [Pyrrhoderma noxium]PAV17324.1 hypothetical protein PNOK_0738800 [Pyrrhoderma noxium]